MTKHFSVNATPYSIRFVMYVGEDSAFDRVVICCHGFAGHKGNAAVRRLAEHMLKKHNSIAFLCFDLPCHGEDVRKKLRLEDCAAYINTVIGYAKNELRAKELYLYATSFGGYLMLKYLADTGNPFRKAALRCPAVRMYDVLLRIMTDEDRTLLANGKTAFIGFDRKIPVDPVFVESLRMADISGLDFSAFADDVLILHGTKDEIVPIDTVREFADKNHIGFIPIQGADHRFIDQSKMGEAITYIEAFF